MATSTIGLFLAMQYPVEIDGVTLLDLLNESSSDVSNINELISHEADLLGLEKIDMARGVNSDMSGGEKKRMETLQLVALKPQIAILDELIQARCRRP